MSNTYSESLGMHINGGNDDSYSGGSTALIVGGVFSLILLIVVLILVAFMMSKKDDDKPKVLPPGGAAGAAGTTGTAGATAAIGAVSAAAAANKAAANKAAAELAATDASRDFGRIICPSGWNTDYNHGVNVAADCQQGKQCNMCIGTGYPTTYTSLTGESKKWPVRPWTTDTAGKTRPSCNATDGATMGYSGGTYITTGLPSTGCPDF